MLARAPSRPALETGSRWLGPAVALLFALAAALPLWLGQGFLNTRGGGDSPFLLFRLHQMAAALADGAFPVRWMPDAAFGLGYPFFSYYAALPYYLAAGFYLAGLSYVQALVLTQTLGFGLAAWSMYAWLNQAGYGRAATWLGAAAYTFAPFHLVNVYVRGDSLSEFWAFAWYPLILLAALRLARRPALRRAAPLALAYAALLLTHNISALIFTPFLLAYVGVLAGSNWLLAIRNSAAISDSRAPSPQLQITKYRTPLLFLAYAAGGIALGLALTAFFWLPALLEGGYGQLETVTQGYFHYAEHFRGFNLIQPGLLFDYSIGSGPEGATPFAMGLAQALLALAGLAGMAAALVRGRLTAHDLCGALGLAAATFMITPLARPLWDNLPLLPLAQFPWRFLSVQAVWAALVAARSLAPWERAAPQRGQLPAWLSLGLSAFLAAAALPGLRLDFMPIGDGDVSAQRLHLYEYFSGNIGTTIRHEYLPRWTTPRPYTSDEFLLRPPRLKALEGEAAGERTAKGAASQAWRITVDTPQALVAVPLLYWPGWTARVDGQSVPVAAAPGLGWIAFLAPEGEHTVTLQLGRTPVRGLAEAFSLAAWLLLAVFGAWPLARSAFNAGRVLRAGAALLAALALAGAAALLPNPRGSVLRLSADFDQLAYYSAAPIRFGNGARLAGYDYSADRLAPGQMLQVTSLWEDMEEGPALTAVLELVLPPAPLRESDTVYASIAFAVGALAVADLRVPQDVAPGVYLLRLTVEGGGEALRALTPSGQPRGALYLRPVWVDGAGSPDGGEGAPEAFGPRLRLLDLSGTQASLDTVDVRMLWEARAETSQNYALALRLNDRSGGEWAALDTQPAFGFYPSGLWRPGEVMPDRLPLSIPIGTPPGEYLLTLTLYEAASQAPIGQASRTVSLPIAAPAAPGIGGVRLSGWLALAGVQAPAQVQQGQTLQLTAEWVTLASPPAGAQAQWLLTDETGEAAFAAAAPLTAAGGPGQWPADSFILGRGSLPLPADLPPGAYRLGLRLLGEAGEIAGRADDLAVIEVLERERLTVPPRDAQRLEARFGEALGMAAFDLRQEGQTLMVIPYWQARAAPEASYKYFVHLFDPQSEEIVAQFDDFPHFGTYPTTQWTAGEVVSDTARIALAGVPPGTYRVALGWYDPQNPAARLRAEDANGRPLELDRVVLPEEVVVR